MLKGYDSGQLESRLSTNLKWDELEAFLEDHSEPAYDNHLLGPCTWYLSDEMLEWVARSASGKEEQDFTVARLEQARQEWVHLLELNVEEALGCLNFWIPKHDLAEQRFGRVWISLGCS